MTLVLLKKIFQGRPNMIQHSCICVNVCVIELQQSELADVSRRLGYALRKPAAAAGVAEVRKSLISKGRTRHPSYGRHNTAEQVIEHSVCLSNRWFVFPVLFLSCCVLILLRSARPPVCTRSRSADHGPTTSIRFAHFCWLRRRPQHSCSVGSPLH